MLLTTILIFITGSLILVFFAKWVIDAITRIADRLGWREFIVAFFVISIGGVAPEFFIGISSAIRGVPDLIFGSIMGQNILLLSLTVALCSFVLNTGIDVESRTVRKTSLFAITAALLPLLLTLDGQLSRIDGTVLIVFFLLFIAWLFSKEEYFKKTWETKKTKSKESYFYFVKDIAIVLVGIFFIILSAELITSSALAFSEKIAIALPVVGMLIIALGIGLPETYFAVSMAIKKQSWMILGQILGVVVISSTMVLGIVSLIRPIEIYDFSPFAVARIFLIIIALMLLFFVRTGRKITHTEGIVLITLYILFFVIEILLP